MGINMAKWDNEKIEKDLADAEKKKIEVIAQHELDRNEYAKRVESNQEKIRRYDRG